MFEYLIDQCENSICLPGQEVVSWAECFSDIPQFVLSRLNLTADKSFYKDNATASCPSSQSGMMSQPSTGNLGEGKLMLSAEDSLARTSQVQAAGQELMEKEVDYGNRWRESLVKYDLATHSWKTHRCLWSEDLPWSSVTLPKWGMMHRGELLERIMLERTTTEKGYGFWPTPVASECRDTWSKPASLAKLYKGDRVARFLCKSWLTSNSMPERVALNPCWQEERMMWPIGQSALKPLAMDKFQAWLHSHGEYLEENK
jgi:hypothetical protein